MFAARGHDRRSPPVKSQGDGRMPTGTGSETTSWSSFVTSTARHGRADSTDEARRSSAHRTRSMCLLVATEDGQMVGFDAVLSLTQLSANRRPTTCQMVAEHRGRPNGLRGHWQTSCEWRREMVRQGVHVAAWVRPSSPDTSNRSRSRLPRYRERGFDNYTCSGIIAPWGVRNGRSNGLAVAIKI